MGRLLLSLLLFLFVFPLKAYASNFTTDYNVTYNIENNAKTHVNFDITLTNTTEQYYASSYTLHLGFSDIQNISASDPEGNIIPQVSTTSSGETVKLDFNKKSVGLGNKLSFKMGFDTQDVASAVGSVWEINVPGLSNQSDFNSFNVNVVYPNFLGSPVSIKPDNSNLINRINGNKITFTKSDLGTSGISLAFGKSQIYSFNLTYHLENKNLFPVTTEIALPPQTNYQDISISFINPRPKNVTVDKDGNWLAQYSLSPSQNLKVIVQGKARVYISPREEDMTDGQLAEYLKEKTYWETSNSKIKELAGELKTPRKIYQYVVDTLTYDFSRVTNNKPRGGAVEVLKDPTSAVCLEFTDLFVALARAAGIPAREVDGFANTKNSKERPLSLVKDVLHAWPEYYDRERKMWVMVDPTWGNTTNGIDYFDELDFDHFAFAVKGIDSTYPIPAGGYKTLKDLSTKDVDVVLSADFSGSPSLSVDFSLPKQALPGLPVSGKLLIKNEGSSISSSQRINIISQFLIPIKKEIDISPIPPFGNAEIPISFSKTNILTNKQDTVTISFDKNLYRRPILISPLALGWGILGGSISAIIIIISIIVFGAGRLPIFRKKQ